MHIHRKIPFSLLLVFGFMFIISVPSLLWAVNLKPLEDAIAEKVKIKRQNPKPLIDMREIIARYDDAAIVSHAIDLKNVPNEPVKKFGIRLLSSVGMQSNDPNIREMVVKGLVGGLDDQDVYKKCGQLLMGYRRADFSQGSKADLKQHFDQVILKGSRNYLAIDTVLLIGVADMKTEMDNLQAIIDQVTEPLQIRANSRQWHKGAFTALKAQARMGDKDAIQRCIAIVDSESDEDFKVITLLKHISYIRQPEAIDYISQFLYSDKMLSSGGPDFKVCSYAFYAARELESIVVGFPSKHDVWPIFYKKMMVDSEFREKWPSFNNYYGEYCSQWLEEQASIKIIR